VRNIVGSGNAILDEHCSSEARDIGEDLYAKEKKHRRE
jgi:hypothetical protein